MRRAPLAWLLLPVVAAAVLAAALLRAGPDRPPPDIEGDASAAPAALAWTASRASPEPGRILTTAVDAEPRRSAAPHRGVRGIVTSPRVVLSDGSHGVDPGSWQATVYALVDRPKRRAVDRIGIFRRPGAVTPRGEFVLDLPTGAHLVLVEHHVRSGAEAVHEAWYAYVDVADDETSPRDLGVHSFGAPLIRGVLRGAGGAPLPGAMVDVSDEQLEPARRLVRGIHLRVLTGDGGRFAVGIARTEGTEVVTRVSARVGSAEARADGVRLGDTIELVLADDGGTDVAFELPWSEGQRVCVRSLDRRLGFMIAGGRAPPGGVQEERRRLPPGRYEVLVTRGARGSEEWARTEVAVDASPGQRIRFDPRFRPARSVRGRLAPGTEVSWLAKATDGSTLVRERTRAGADGLFALHGLPTSEVLLQLGTTLTAVPAGTAPDVDLGEPNPR